MNTVLLINLIKIRWLAIIGQLSTLLIVVLVLDFSIPFKECLGVVFLSIIINILSSYIVKDVPTLSYNKTFIFLTFDVTQLIILLYLTGGVFNPFIILILAPVIISASYLPAFWTISLSIYSIILILIINFNYVPLDWEENFITPDIYKIGILTALIITIVFIAIYAYLFASSSRKISDALSEIKLKLSNQKKTTEVAYLSAAAVHELSTPLNTIFLVINDLIKEKIFLKNPNLMKEIELLKSQAERCKEILLRLSKNPQNLKDNFLKKVKISDIVKINFEKFNTNKILKINTNNHIEKEIIFKDEIMYALGNLIQNAIIYSKKFVFVDIKIKTNIYNIIISDDGPGFSKDIVEKLGQPYVSKNKKGLGLGIFISKNLIEGLNGEIFFKNSKNNKAVVEINLNINKLS